MRVLTVSKHYSVENFYIGDDFVHCYTTWTRNGFCHHAEYYNANFDMIAKKRVSYYNRTWERFEYESCLQELAAKLPRTERLGVEAFCVQHAKQVAEDCQKWLDGFKSVIDKLSDAQRESLANAVGHIDSEEKANTAMLMAATMAVAS